MAVAQAPPTFAAPRPVETTGLVEAKVNGEFNGFGGETIIKTINGQIWLQNEYCYYRYVFMPNVIIFPAAGGHKMQVDGVPRPVGVVRLR